LFQRVNSACRTLNFCSFQGTCNSNGTCTCYNDFSGSNCAILTNPPNSSASLPYGKLDNVVPIIVGVITAAVVVVSAGFIFVYYRRSFKDKKKNEEMEMEQAQEIVVETKPKGIQITSSSTKN